MGTLSFEPLIPLALWLVLVLAGLGLMTWYCWRRPTAVLRQRWLCIIALMGIGLALVLLVLLNPTWIEPMTPPAGKPLLTVLVDATTSMATSDAGAGLTRYSAAAELARRCARELSDSFDVRIMTFATAPTAVAAETLESRSPDGQLTDLAAAVTGSLEENRPQGQTLILLSDGIHNGGGTARVLDAARLAKAMACKIYTRTFGGAAQLKDLAVELRSSQELAYIGQRLPLTVHVRQRGLSGGQATLILRHNGRELERRQVPLSSNGDAEARFEVRRDKAGLYSYEVQAEPFRGEVSLGNNTATFLLRVVDQPIRVLLLEGKPYWDGKFLTRTLLGDPSVELDSVVRVSDSRFLRRRLSRVKTNKAPTSPSPSKSPDTPRSVPSNEPAQEDWTILDSLPEFLAAGDSLRSYQIVVLGRDTEVFLTEPVLAQLRQWIQRDGGSLVCYRGQPMPQVDQRLGQLLPLRWMPGREARFSISLTERGRDLHWFESGRSPGSSDALSSLPTLASTARPERPKPLAVVLATAVRPEAGSEEPAVIYQPYGSGRIVVIEGAGMWRWVFLPPQQQKQDEVYRTMWHSLIRWLISSADLLPGQQRALRSDKVRFSTTEPATATLLVREESARGQVPAIELRGGTLSKPRMIAPVPLGDEPGAYRVVFGKLEEGHYQARVEGGKTGDTASEAVFDVRSLFEEQLDLQARPALMARIALESGGVVLTGDTPAETLHQFQDDLARHGHVRVRRIAAWDRWWVLLTIFAVWGTAWGLRRSGGLV